MRRVFFAVVIVAVVAVGIWLTYQYLNRSTETPEPDYEVYTVTTGDIASTVTASGSIDPESEVNLAFRGSGRVAQVLTQVGEQVKSGQVLARLETDDAILAREQAAAGLRLAEARYAQATRPPNDNDLAVAQANLASARAGLAAARASYQQLLNGPTAAQRLAAEANEKKARVILERAQSAFNEVSNQPNASMLPQSLQLEQATIDYEVAKANVESTLAPATAAQKAGALAQIAQAEAAVAQAEAALARLQDGASTEDIEILQAQIDQARSGMLQAELALKNAELVSPIDGVVGAVNISPNEFPSPGQAAVVLTDGSQYHLNLNVDEVDIAKIAPGQATTISLDAFPDAELSGVVTRIDPIARVGSGLSQAVVTYRVRIDIDPNELPLRPGLTGSVAIVTDEARETVVVPNRIIRIDRQTGENYVEKLVNGVPERVPLTIGLRNEQFSQVLSGLKSGDEVAVRRTETGDVIRQQLFGG